MNIPEVLKTKKWTKNWSGNWGLLFATTYGDIYTRKLHDLIGKNFSNNLITFESGASANYIPQDELKDYCLHATALILKDPKIPERWMDQVIKKTDEIFALMKYLDSKDTFTQKDYSDLQEVRAEITAPNFTIKKIIDYLPEDLVSKFLDKFTETSVYTEPVYNETDRILKKIVGAMLPDLHESKYLSVITQNEIENYFRTGNKPDMDSLESRYKKSAYLYNEQGQESAVLLGEDFDEVIKTVTSLSDKNQIKGMTAFKGKAQGRVRVVLDPANALDFKEGDILVTGMTRPEYLQLMKKSAAFITDAGGLLSHAAIVARELQKPCIVGTEMATKILKDGDMVEVDADNGVVRIIK